MTTASSDIAIAGFGFGGLMVLANLVRKAEKPLSITIFGRELRGTGLAYGTRNPLHLLNVPARNMSAWGDEGDDFLHWLAGADAADAQQTLGLAHLPGATGFAPRMLYGRYLDSIREATLAWAASKNITVTLLQEELRDVAHTAQGWQLNHTHTAQRLVLATGNEVKPIFPHLPHPAIIENPWLLSADEVSAWGHQPIAMIGTGLTAVDMVLSLRRMGYTGVIHAVSRNGLLPLPHVRDIASYPLDTQALLSQTTLLGLLRFVRAAIHSHSKEGGDWRAVIDALRPHARTLWQRLSPREQNNFIRRLATMWNSHRHRMAPEIADIMRSEITSGKTRLIPSHHFHPTEEGAGLKLAIRRNDGELETLTPAAILNCTGPELNWTRSAQPVLQQLLQQNAVVTHATGLGVKANAQFNVGKNLYAIGGLMTGQFWESTAIPELRQQAATIAEALCQ